VPAIIGFEQDEAGDWVALLDCGHRQHMRHKPPFIVRAWVVSAAGRASMLGTQVRCPYCEGERGSPGSAPQP
jgi:hypothetical protein